jgi:hypothetical protein
MSLPCGMEDDDDMAASFIMDENAVQFANQNVHISKEGLTINGVTISDIKQVSSSCYLLFKTTKSKQNAALSLAESCNARR